MIYIHEFPELRPRVWVANTDWIRTISLLEKKVAKLGTVERIVVNGPLILYGNAPKIVEDKCGIPVLTRDQIGKELPPGTLSMYFLNIDYSYRQFKKDFDCTLGEDGEILTTS